MQLCNNTFPGYSLGGIPHLLCVTWPISELLIDLIDVQVLNEAFLYVFIGTC